ncbi:MAG: transposase, partial [Bacteroidota bacterium]
PWYTITQSPFVPVHQQKHMRDDRTFFRRKLPHDQLEYATFFITFRLAGTLPGEAVERLRAEREKALRAVGQEDILSYRFQMEYFAKYDAILDGTTHGPTWLNDERIAKIVADSLHYWDGKRYTLLCYSIMPNHVHLLIDIRPEKVGQVGNLSYTADDKAQQAGNLSYTLSRILHSIKRHTAREANKILNRAGPFWQHESYDHIIRDNDELERIIWYILDNSVKAGLVEHWKNWRGNYVQEQIAPE